jgi:pimeloyl-ACP methyl ester carboxylesterase
MQTQAARVDQVVQLSDGRVLGYAEYGPATGPALVLCHGSPGSRLDAPHMWPGEPAIRVIAPDRPGFGTSTFQPGRRLTDWADDVRQLADSLRIDRFLVAGFSGGGPHALAVAHELPDRVIAAGCIGGAGPIEGPDALAGMNRANRMIFRLARKTPQALGLLIAPHAYLIRHQPGRVVDRATRDRHMPEADRAVMADPRQRELMITAGTEAFRQGIRGLIHEAHICAQPWGFDPATISPPVFLWHGDHDTNVPIAMARHLAAQIPHSTLTIYPNEGHLTVPKHWPEIQATFLSVPQRLPLP